MRIFEFIKNMFFALILLQIAPPLIKNVIKVYSDLLEPKTRVAVIPIQGSLDLHDAAPIIKQLHTYFKDQTIKAIVLKIESPGGATGTALSIYEEIISLKAQYQKPIITIVDNVCASGAYLIACATDNITATGMSLIGSIGVSFSRLFQLRNLIEKYDVGYIPLTAGSYKSTGDPFVDITAEQKTMLQQCANNVYDQFTALVIQQRKLSTTNLKEWADGKIFTGKEALNLGLIDNLGSVSTATKIVKEKAMIEGEIEWVKKQKPLSIIARLFSEEQGDNDSSLLESTVHTICTTIENRYNTIRL